MTKQVVVSKSYIEEMKKLRIGIKYCMCIEVLKDPETKV